MPILPAVSLFTRTAKPGEIAHFRDTSFICGLELLTVAAAVFSLRRRLRGFAVTLYVDNNAAPSALIKSDARSTPDFRTISFLRYVGAVFDIAIWFGRFSSDLNIARLPSRGKTLPPPRPESGRYELPPAKYCD